MCVVPDLSSRTTGRIVSFSPPAVHVSVSLPSPPCFGQGFGPRFDRARVDALDHFLIEREAAEFRTFLPVEVVSSLVARQPFGRWTMIASAP